MKRFHKNASLNLSIQAIVILIFAVIMLGLGLGLINFIFGAARSKVGGALGAAQLTNPPSADDPVTLETNIQIKLKGEQQIQIGFYNREQATKYNVEPKLEECKTGRGAVLSNTGADAALPILSTVSQSKAETGEVVGWNAIILLPDLDMISGGADPPPGPGDTYEGALAPGQYICKISIYGAPSDTPGDTQVVLESDQVFLKVST